MKQPTTITKKEITETCTAELLQPQIFGYFREYLKLPVNCQPIQAARDYYKSMTNPEAPDIALAYYAAYSSGLLKGLEVYEDIRTNKERSRKE